MHAYKLLEFTKSVKMSKPFEIFHVDSCTQNLTGYGTLTGDNFFNTTPKWVIRTLTYSCNDSLQLYWRPSQIKLPHARNVHVKLNLVTKNLTSTWLNPKLLESTRTSQNIEPTTNNLHFSEITNATWNYWAVHEHITLSPPWWVPTNLHAPLVARCTCQLINLQI